MRIRRRTAAWTLLLTAVFAGSILLSGPGSGAAADARGPNGTLALRHVLTNLGVSVTMNAVVPSPGRGTFVLFADVREAGEVRRLVQWARSGGTLVVADPGSLVLDELSARPAANPAGFGSRSLPAGCATPATIGVRTIRVADADARVDARDGIQCFTFDGRSFLAHVPVGEGRVIMLGGISPFTNRLLAADDNARFAAQLLGQSPVEFGTPVGPDPEGESGGLWHMLPGDARAVILQLCAAAVLFALARGRRLGRPIEETPLSPIPGGELVRATARLLRSGRATTEAAEWIREYFARRRNDGAPPPPAGEDISPAGDSELIALAARMEQTRRHLEEDP